MRKSVLVAILVFIPMSFVHAQLPTEEREALIALYNATNGPGWTNNSNWLGSVDTECTWHGVTCSGGHVTELWLQFNQLAGPIPSELGDLTSAKTLSLGGNQLSGSIPPELENLSSVLYLYLHANDLSGTIPPKLGNLSNLRTLQLNFNDLSGSIPPELGNLTNLWTLKLGSNQLTGSIPAELGSMSSLKEMFLDRNPLSGGIPPEFGNLSNLTKLDLDWTELTEPIPPEFGNLSSLEVLHLFDSQLRGPIPPELENLSSLTYLALGGNHLSGRIPPELGNLSNLEHLFLDSNQLDGSIPSTLSNLSSLITLRLSSNRLSGQIPAELGSLSLGSLYLFSNRLSGEIPAELANITGLSDGSSLRIRWNALHTENASLIAFLDAKQLDGDWQSTQTIAPVNLTVGSLGDHTVWLSWDTVSYQSDPGGYEVFSAPTGTGVWTSGGWTEPKTSNTFPITGLDPGTIYDLAVLTYTAPHTDNLNLVHSDFSLQVMATTSSGGCAQPIIEQAGVDPITLSLSTSWDSYLWSTGETDPSIVVDPQLWKWYWVTVTSTGPCEETAATWVGLETPVFADGFESGDTSEWSSTVP